jgi:hypothetical protein
MAQPRTNQDDFDVAISKVKEIDWARLAAYIDGEGTIMIARTKRHKGTKMPQFVLTLIVANTDMRLISWLSETFTGEHYYSNSGSLFGWTKKTCFSWRMYEKRAITILERVRPYLICKGEQADVAFAYRKLRDQGSKGRKLTLVDIKERTQLRNKICKLNGTTISQEDQEIANG